MDFEARWHAVATPMVVAVVTWLFMWFRRGVAESRPVTYRPHGRERPVED
jgi:hypothetical protein